MRLNYLLFNFIPKNRFFNLMIPRALEKTHVLKVILNNKSKKLPFLWMPLFLIHHISYYYYFHQGCIQRAYKHRIQSLILVLMNMEVNQHYRKGALRYFKLLADAGSIQEFLEYENLNYVNDQLLNCEFKATVSRSPLNKEVFILGPITSLPEINRSFDTICIKPERFTNEIQSPLIAYYNSHDFNVFNDQILKLLHDGKINKVITPAKGISLMDWAIRAELPETGLSFFSPLAINVLLNTCRNLGYNKVHLRGFNFYLGEKIYETNYYSNLKTNQENVDQYKFFDSLARHDILLNYVLLRNSYLNGFVETDKMLDYLKITNPSEYLKLFENKYKKLYNSSYILS